MKWRRLDDSAHTQVLETVVIASIMVSAVTFVATFESPPKGSAPTRDLLQTQLDDALSILYDTPVQGSSFGTNALSVYIAECLQGTCTNLTGKLGKLLPEGASYALYVSNGQSTFPVYVTHEPSGETVTATHLMEPSWSNSFVSTGTDLVNPAQDPLLLYTLPIFNSNPLAPGGSPLRIRVHALDAQTGADFTLTSYASTQAYDVSDVTKASAVSLYFVDGAGHPLPMTTLEDELVPGLEPVRFTLRLNETAGVAVPAGANLTVSLPRGWTATANATDNAAHWEVLGNATDSTGSASGGDIYARLAHDVSGGAVDFYIDAVYHGDVLDFYPIHAKLSRGALSTATLLVRAAYHTTTPPFETPALYASVPRPMGATATTTWTLAATIPSNVQSSSTITGSAYIIDRIEIEELDGNAIFGSISASDVSIEGQIVIGTWASQGTSLVWSGYGPLVSSISALNMTFKVTASGVAGASDSRSPFTPPVTFDAGTGRVLTQHSPGFFRGTFLPAEGSKGYIGYHNHSAPALVDETIRSDLVYRSTELPGSTVVHSGATNPARAAIFGSYVDVEERNVPVGGEVVLTTDVQSILFALAEAGHSAGITVNFYPPWTGDEHTPIWTDSSLDAGLLKSIPMQMVLHDVNGDGVADPIVGTSNGRVFALDARSGARLPGLAYVAPLRLGVDLTSAASIQQLTKVVYDGATHLVVGTDGKSTGLVVLDESFEEVWSFDLKGREVLALNTDTDLNGDGRKEIIVAVAVEDASAVYVLQAIEGESSLSPIAPAIPVAEAVPLWDSLPVLSATDVSQIDDAFYIAPGRASALVSVDSIGEETDGAGFAVTLQTIADVDADLNVNLANPGAPVSHKASLPRAGFEGVNAEGTAIYTFFGTPVTEAMPYDFDGEGAMDIVAAGPAGYVLMMNGTAATQPIYSLVLTGPETIIDAASPSLFESYILTDDGSLYFTDDGWGSTYCINCDPVTQVNVPIPTATAIAVTGSAALWLVGTGNTLYQSEPDVNPPSATLAANLEAAPTPKPILMKPKVPVAVKFDAVSQLPSVYSFATNVHDFADVHFGEGDDAQRGWIIGSNCDLSGAGLPACQESLVMSTIDGGANWQVASHGDPVNSLVAADGGSVSSTLRRIVFPTESVGWIVGDDGTILRSSDGGVSWHGLPSPTSENLLDLQCVPGTATRCFVVGENGAAYATTNAHDAAADVEWTALGVAESAGAKDLYSVGFQDAQTGYIGAHNAVLKTYDGGATWTTLPLNYVENDGRVVNVFGDGTGYVYGGGPGNARIWFLQDYAREGVARTNPLTSDLPDGARITRVEVTSSNLSSNDGSNALQIFASTNGSDWSFLQPNLEETEGRNVKFAPVDFGDGAGDDLRIEFQLTVNRDKTLLTPTVRGLDLLVTYELDGAQQTTPVSLDFTTEAQLDQANTTAAWDAAIGTLHAAIVQEYWVRNVSGEVLDIKTGWDVTGDGLDEIWVSTGDVLALNSPDYAIYAGPDKSRALSADNRVYLLDGSNGTILAKSSVLAGRVVSMTMFDEDGDGVADTVYAVTGESEVENVIQRLDATTLSSGSSREIPGPATVILPGLDEDGDRVAFLGTGDDALGTVVAGGRILSMDTSDPLIPELWRAIPEDRGRYLVTADIPDNWFFGPYVVEVAVEWEEVLPLGETVLQSARVYDYFVVTPPDSLSPASPIYDVHLVAWFDDWR